MNTIKYAVSITDESVNINTPIMLSGPFEECFRAAAEAPAVMQRYFFEP